jgi:hypothetical protein
MKSGGTEAQDKRCRICLVRGARFANEWDFCSRECSKDFWARDEAGEAHLGQGGTVQAVQRLIQLPARNHTHYHGPVASAGVSPKPPVGVLCADDRNTASPNDAAVLQLILHRVGHIDVGNGHLGAHERPRLRA